MRHICSDILRYVFDWEMIITTGHFHGCILHGKARAFGGWRPLGSRADICPFWGYRPRNFNSGHPSPRRDSLHISSTSIA